MTAAQKVLIADDDTSIRLVLSKAFTRAGFQVRATGSISTLLKWVQEGEGDLVITDVLMPDENAFDVLPRLRKIRPQLPTIVMSAQNTLLTAVGAAQIGAFEYMPKPFDLDEMVATACRALSRPPEAAKANAQARAQRDDSLPLIGRSAPMQEVYRVLARLVDNALGVLITGESGAGKALAARALHDLGPRSRRPFVAVSLGGLDAARADAILLGASPERPGKLAEADGGTLFLDRIGDAAPAVQMRLLQLLDGLERPGAPGGERPLDVRIVAAAGEDIDERAADGRFRPELLSRLDVVRLRLPPLRERLDDVAELGRAFLLRAHRQGLPPKTLDARALERLQRHEWPGNVRELQNLMSRLAALCPEEAITAQMVERELAGARPAGPQASTSTAAASLEDTVERHLQGVFAAAPGSSPPDGLYDRMLEMLERPMIRVTLSATGGNQIKAADILGINRNTLRKKIDDLGLKVERRAR